MSELIRHFGIDWKLLLAQAVNFLILLVVLKKFAYGPILKILKKRKDEIEKGLKFTKEAGERLEQIGEEKEAVLKEARGEALGIVSQAENTAKIRKDEIFFQFRNDGYGRKTNIHFSFQQFLRADRRNIQRKRIIF